MHQLRVHFKHNTYTGYSQEVFIWTISHIKYHIEYWRLLVYSGNDHGMFGPDRRVKPTTPAGTDAKKRNSKKNKRMIVEEEDQMECARLSVTEPESNKLKKRRDEKE